MAAKILEEYMKTTASAVLTVVNSVESLKTTISQEEAAAISVAMYGAPPKPSVSDVATISHPHKRRKLEDKMLIDNDAVLSMSVARYGIQKNLERVEAILENIERIMIEIAVSSNRMMPDEIFVGLHEPYIDSTKYKLIEGEEETIESFKNCMQSVEENLKEVFENTLYLEDLHIDYVLKNINPALRWANCIEMELKSKQASPPQPAVFRRSVVIRAAVTELKRLVGKSICRTATQLISAQDIHAFEDATRCCYNALLATIHEQIISNVLFDVFFELSEKNEKKIAQKRLKLNEEPFFIKRRDAAETLFGLCFISIVMPGMADVVFTFPPKHLHHSEWTESCSIKVLRKILNPHFENSWICFQNVLAERKRQVIKYEDLRIDNVDAIANLTGPVYFLISDVNNALEQLRISAYKFFNKTSMHCSLWKKLIKFQKKVDLE